MFSPLRPNNLYRSTSRITGVRGFLLYKDYIVCEQSKHLDDLQLAEIDY